MACFCAVMSTAGSRAEERLEFRALFLHMTKSKIFLENKGLFITTINKLNSLMYVFFFLIFNKIILQVYGINN